MRIRDMTGSDLEAVIAVIGLSDDDDAGAARAYYEELWAGAEEDGPGGSAHDFVCVDGSDRVIGIGGVQRDDGEGDGIWWLSWWYVDPAHQDRGVGKALMEESLRWARDRKARKIYVDVSSLDFYAKARRFYAAHGFVEEARLKDYYAEGEDMILMAKVVGGAVMTGGGAGEGAQ